MPDIFQLSTIPISPEKRMSESDIERITEYGDFIDYVYEEGLKEDEMAEAILTVLAYRDSACSRCLDVVRDDAGTVQSVVFREGYRQAYFADAYEAFQQALHQLVSATTFDAFALGQLSMGLHKLSRAHEDMYGTYIYSDEELTPLDSFVRGIEIDTAYHIGGGLIYK